MNGRAASVLGFVLVAGGFGAWWLLRTDSSPAEPGATAPAQVLQQTGAELATKPVVAPPASSRPTAAPAPLAEEQAPPPDPARPRLVVRWFGAPVPMTRDPLPEFSAQLSGGAARLAVRAVQAPLSKVGSAVTLDAAVGSHDLVLRSGGAVVWSERRELPAGPTEIVLDAAQLPGVAGRCVNEQGQPMEGVTVTINSVLTGSVVSVITSADGSFQVPFLSAELLYDGKAASPGYLVALADPWQLEPDRLTLLPAFVLRAARVVSGRVQLEDGTPVMGCPVLAVAPHARSQATCDDDGRFRFDDLPPGDVRVSTTHSMLRDASVLLPDAVEERHAVLVLDEGSFIDGTVRTEAGAAAPGFLWLTGVPLGTGDGPVPDREAAAQSAQVSGTPATFRLGPFPPGPVEITEGFGAFEPVRASAPGSIEIVLPAQRMLEVALRFTDATTGQPITKLGTYGLVIELHTGGNGSKSGPPVQPDGNGTWTLRAEVSPSASASLVVRFAGYSPATVDALETLPSPSPPVEVAVLPDAGFTVRVLDAGGAPVKGAAVFLVWQVDPASITERRAGGTPSFANRRWFADGTALTSQATSDEDGLARMPRIGDGAMVCVVRAEGFLSWFQRFAEPPAASAPQPPSADGVVPDLTLTLTPAPSHGR